MTALAHLAALAGILPSYRDAWGNRRLISATTERALLAAMGFPADSPEQIADHIRQLEDAPFRNPLPPVMVVKAGNEVLPGIAISLPAGCARDIPWRVELETGEVWDGDLHFTTLPLVDRRLIDGDIIERRRFSLDFPLPLGYHRFHLDAASLSLIATPPRCYLPPAHDRLWGMAVQLYGLRSDRNWGIGDFSDLAATVRLGAQVGAAAIGLNPLHALFPENPLHISPYSPSHRQFLGMIYLDVEAVPDLADCAAAQRLVQDVGVQATLRELRATPLVDYEKVAAAKRPVLELLYQHFRDHHLAGGKTGDRAAAFRRFQRLRGKSLEDLGVFQALSEHFNRPWPSWPAAYRDPQSLETAHFAAAQRHRIEFFQYLQWQAELQLAAAADCAKDSGMAVGLYHDLALAPDAISAEVWANQSVFAPGVRLGAPPDDWNLKGQNWGVMPYNPPALRDAAYAPFRAVMVANMNHCGALRIDHVMGLERLYWIPDGADPEDGGYVRYPVDDLLGVLALESQRQRCLVIGEDLGTLPEGFHDRLRAADMLSYRLLYFSQDAGGAFLPPSDYPAMAAVAVSTHDLTPLAGFWRGCDLEVRAELGLYPSDAIKAAERARRAKDRRELIAALKREGLLAADVAADFTDDEAAFSFGLALAVYRFLARTPARLLLLGLEDVLADENQANLPGTVFEHPNWRRKMAASLQELAQDPRFAAIAAALTAERGGGSMPS